MKIANIVTSNKIECSDNINIVSDYDDIIVGLPTLVTSYEWLTKNYDDYDIYNKKLDDNLYWTFAKTERRDIFTVDVEQFITLVNKQLINNIKYQYIDLIQFRGKTIKKIIKKLYSLSRKISFKNNDMIYIYGDNIIFGLNLEIVEYMGLDRILIENKIKVKSDVFLDDEEIFIEYKDNMERLNHSIKYIPYLYSIKYE